MLAHFKKHHRRKQQRDAREHLIGRAEKRPQRVNSAHRIGNAAVEQIAPARHADHRRDDAVEGIFGIGKGLIDVA